MQRGAPEDDVGLSEVAEARGDYCFHWMERVWKTAADLRTTSGVRLSTGRAKRA